MSKLRYRKRNIATGPDGEYIAKAHCLTCDCTSANEQEELDNRIQAEWALKERLDVMMRDETEKTR